MAIYKDHTCLVCGRPLTLHQCYSGRVCADWRCRERVLRDALLAHRQEAARALGVAQDEAYPIAVVPWRPQKLVPIEDAQRSELRQFLLELLAQSPAAQSQPPAGGEDREAHAMQAAMPADGALDTLLASVCAVCRGFCCFYGGTRHAFLDADTLRAFRRRNPELDGTAAAKVYLDFLPEQHCVGSCLYHTAAGCKLPRAMRAHICNAYECPGLKDARRAYAGRGTTRACVVVRHDSHIMGSAFVDAVGIAAYPPEQ
jgi:hypothetical protein